MTRSDQPRLPGDRGHLQRLVNAHADKAGVPPGRVQGWLNAMVVAALLDRVRDEGDEPVFLLKGGMAMELRLRLRARATKDYDAAFRARADEVLDLLDKALQGTYNDFTVTRDAPEDIKNTGAMRLRLRLAYKGRDWGSVRLELAPVEGQMGTELDRVESVPIDDLQVPMPATISCVSVRYQVAQKLHACTEVFTDGPENGRFRDVMDILLIESLIRDEVGLDRARDACFDIFEVRGKHTWPPEITVYESWREPFSALAEKNSFKPEDVNEAVERLRQLSADINAADSTV
ncbi:MAG TPA: nucleotidyl transferase AbiEii/AbiGii toxin family protein [Solirubrobacteraceae bacterium]|nr:nucleotidyl transferase AbiEii/AbiGii toxin family protein [Solirubrobacteraceae bacterium]